MKLLCLLLNTNNDPFEVEIDPQATILDLKHAIKATRPYALAHRHTSEIFLSVARTGSHWLSRKAKYLPQILADDVRGLQDLVRKRLDATATVNEYFACAPPRTIHVLILVTQVRLTLSCLLVGGRGDPFEIGMDPASTIDDLINAIKKLHADTLADAYIDYIDLFAARRGNQWLSSDSEELTQLSAGSLGSLKDFLCNHLEQFIQIDTYFKNLPSSTIQVLVRPPLRLCCVVAGMRGEPFELQIPPNATIRDLNDAIKSEAPGALAHLTSWDLELFTAKHNDRWLPLDCGHVKTLTSGELHGLLGYFQQPLSSESTLENIFRDLDGQVVHLLVLQVTNTTDIWRRFRHPERRERWSRLNTCFDEARDRRANYLQVSMVRREKPCGTCGTGPDVPVSSAWQRAVREIQLDVHYTQERKQVPEEHVAEIYEYLKTNGSQVFPISYLESFFLAMCRLVGDGTTLLVDDFVVGAAVHATVPFDFVITRDNRRLCITVGTEHNFDEACARAVVGCEVVADVYRLPVVYGLATDFARWNLYRQGEDSILVEKTMLPASSGVPDYEALRDKCNMIYSVLCGDDCNERFSLFL